MQVTQALNAPHLTRSSGSRQAGAPPDPQDQVDQGTPMVRFLRALPPVPRGAVVGFGTMSVPMLGGQLGGFPGLAVGAAAGFAFNYAIDKDPRRALGAVVWPAILGGILASTGNPPTALSVGMVAGMGLAFGALAGWRAQMEEQARA